MWSPDLYGDASTPAGVRLIVPERPGFGRSDVLVGCTLGGWTSDMVELADALELPRFGVVGFSAGTPWAAACGALIPERVTRIGIAHSRALAAYDFAERPEAVEALTDEDSRDYELVRDLGPEAAAEALIAQEEAWAMDVAEHPVRVMDGYTMPEGDRWLWDDPALARFLLDGFRYAVRQGALGMVWEFIAYVQPWDSHSPTSRSRWTLWHGAQDPPSRWRARSSSSGPSLMLAPRCGRTWGTSASPSTGPRSSRRSADRSPHLANPSLGVRASPSAGAISADASAKLIPADGPPRIGATDLEFNALCFQSSTAFLRTVAFAISPSVWNAAPLQQDTVRCRKLR